MSRVYVRRRRDWLVIGMGAICLICLVVTLVVSATTLRNREDLLDQKAGRAVALDVTCGAASAVIEAGRRTITGSSVARDPKTGKVDQKRELALRKLGFPPLKVRERHAAEAAAEYAREIARRVEEQSGRRGLVRKDGALDCGRLKRAVGAAG